MLDLVFVTLISTTLATQLGTIQMTVGDCKTNASSVADLLVGKLPPSASIEKIAYVETGDTYGEGRRNLMYPIQPTNLPELCAVTIYVPTSSTSAYRFGIFLPVNWNSRFLTVGNGGFGGGINWLDMGAYVKYGFAVVSTDTGHNSTTGDGSWAFKNPEKRTDWGWRAMHGTVDISKQIVEAYYGVNIKYSYYNGCSTGGRQGLRQVQIDPDSFDGVIIGAPGWYTTNLNTWFTKAGIYNLPETDPKHIPFNLFSTMADLVIRQCDMLDGVYDGIVSLPDACVPDWTEILCSNPDADPSACLTEAQASTPPNVYGDFVSSSGELIHPGLSPGCEGQWFAVLNFTNTSPFGFNYIRFFLLDNIFWNYTYWDDSLVTYAQLTDPGQSTANDYNLTTFKDLGHKMLMYHGLADGLIPPRGSDLYYRNTLATMGENLSSVSEWFRYFQVPGMQHCWSTATSPNSPWYFGAEFQAAQMGTDIWSVPGFEDKDHDILLALMDWVENGNPVNALVATAWNDVWNTSSGVKSQRPICPYPNMAVWDGIGDINLAASWTCGYVSSDDRRW
ncbi:hypothetical protein JX266_011319 [Neoarthrinium moseri]|nr:hypothetical protein JX266_011319 [Neoarthrinium moseri]